MTGEEGEDAIDRRMLFIAVLLLLLLMEYRMPGIVINLNRFLTLNWSFHLLAAYFY